MSTPDASSAAKDAPARRLGFLLAGVQKGGTTSLYKMLAKHPQIATSSRKELHFFDDDRRDWSSPEYGDYHRHITWPEAATIAGEATPSYLFWPGAMERIKAYNPDMRLVLSFRDPVERAFSQWCMVKDRKPRTPEFADAIRTVRPTRWPRSAEEAGRASLAFVGRGYYGEQLAHVLELFPTEQVLLLDFHRMFKELQSTLDRITDALGIDRFAELPAEFRRRAQPDALAAAPPTEQDVAMLADLYVEDLAAFAALSGIDVSDWSSTKVAHGSLAPAALAAKLAGNTTFTELTAGSEAPAVSPGS